MNEKSSCDMNVGLGKEESGILVQYESQKLYQVKIAEPKTKTDIILLILKNYVYAKMGPSIARALVGHLEKNRLVMLQDV